MVVKTMKRKLDQEKPAKGQQKNGTDTTSDPENRIRKPFTQGWQDEMNLVDALPIKQGKKVLKVKKAPTKTNDEEENVNVVDVSDDEADVSEEVTERRKAHLKQLERQVKRESIPIVFVERTGNEYHQLQQQLAAICTSIVSNPEQACLKVKKQNDEKNTIDADESPYQQYRVQDLLDIVGTSQDAQEVELALLSSAVVFKDICPGYRIQANGTNGDANGQEVQLKKETKKLKEFEMSLLRHYQRYLSLLDSFVQWGLGSVRSVPKTWSVNQDLAIVAYKCQCELIKSLYHFNFRSQLISSILNRSIQHLPQVSEVAAATLTYLFQHDPLGELSFEIVGTFNKTLSISKFSLPTDILEAFERVKITVHADQVKSLQVQAKLAKKQRRKSGNDVEKEVEVGLMEANAEQDEFMKKKFQGNCLQELTLIYFRILKNGKLTGELLPTALHGLARLTHFIDIDTVNDLMSILKHILELPVVNAPHATKLLSIHCAIKTLAGPGAELKLDDSVYYQSLLLITAEIHTHPSKLIIGDSNINVNGKGKSEFTQWVSLLECIDMAIIQRREDRNEIVEGIVKHLLINALEQFQLQKYPLVRVILVLAHNILLRYPKVKEVFLEEMQLNVPILLEGAQTTTTANRNNFHRPSSMIDDHAEDLAMKGLRDPLHGKGILQSNYSKTMKIQYTNRQFTIYAHCGTWAMIILKELSTNPDGEQQREIQGIFSVLTAMAAKEFKPILWRTADLKQMIEGKVEWSTANSRKQDSQGNSNTNHALKGKGKKNTQQQVVGKKKNNK